MMRASVVSAPTPRACTCSRPAVATVPAYTASPSVFSAGMDSPVMDASSTAPTPVSTTPSTGTRAPALTRTVAPGATSWAGTVRWVPSASTTTAVSGAVDTRSASAERV